jgi:hypothetical protein
MRGQSERRGAALNGETRSTLVCWLSPYSSMSPLWSNDRDFENTGVSQFTTGELLAVLFGDRGH